MDPRLVAEFKLNTASEDFHIINIEQLTKILIRKFNNDFIDLAKALQIAGDKVVEPIEEVITEEQVVKDTPDIRPDNKTKSSTKSTTKVNIDTAKLNFSKYALADRDYLLFGDDLFTTTIEKLKSYNWYVQNPALDNFLKSSSQPIEENSINQDALFVIGRNIYQAANGGSGSANWIFRRLKTTICSL